MCPHRAKKLMILSRTEYLVILKPHSYRRTSTTVSSPSVRGAQLGDACRLFGHATTPPRMYEVPVRRSGGIATPQGPRPASSDMAPHRPACMRARLDGRVYLGGSNAARCCFGPSYGCGSVVAGAGTRHAAPGCALHLRCRCGARSGGSNVREGGNRYTIWVCFFVRQGTFMS